LLDVAATDAAPVPPLALLPPIAIELAPLALVQVPIAVLASALAVLSEPSARL
jgi:hypothetical protein